MMVGAGVGVEAGPARSRADPADHVFGFQHAQRTVYRVKRDGRHPSADPPVKGLGVGVCRRRNQLTVNLNALMGRFEPALTANRHKISDALFDGIAYCHVQDAGIEMDFGLAKPGLANTEMNNHPIDSRATLSKAQTRSVSSVSDRGTRYCVFLVD